MIGLLIKIWYEVRWPVKFFSLGLGIIMCLLTILLPKVLGDIHRVFEKMPFVKPLITALLGIDPGNQLTAQMTQAFLWVHPTVLTLIWAHEVMYCTRMPAGEVDRGTMDFLMSLPMSRWKIFIAETIGWILTGVIILAGGLLGHSIASNFLRPEMQASFRQAAFVILNLFCVYLVVGSFSFLVSSCCDRRGRAMGIVFAVLLLSFLLNFLAQFWDVAKLFRFLSVLEYYRPAVIIQSNTFPMQDIVILLSLAGLIWGAAGTVFRHRSLCTV
ncbi:MAG: ABC transporter permease subunit [Planctomyces sp.]|nr:ABC transporter permease subunit [Planctomyces sp.]